MTPTKNFAMTLAGPLVGLASITALAACVKSSLAQAPGSGPIVKIVASKFHFTPDHITLEEGRPVTLELTSTDTTHGFLIRALKIDTDIRPGQVTDITVTPAAAGTFKAIFDLYCGLGHAGMKMTVVIEQAARQA